MTNKLKLFLLGVITAIILISCLACSGGGESNEIIPEYKYEVGDVVSFKIDSTKCIITKRCYYEYEDRINYRVRYRGEENDYSSTYVNEMEIFIPETKVQQYDDGL